MKELPANVHLLTLEHLENNTVLLRLEHQFAVGEAMSQPANVSLAVSTLFNIVSLCISLLPMHSSSASFSSYCLQGLFSSFTVKDVTELTLGGNAPLSDVNRLHWNTGDDCKCYCCSSSTL